MSSLSGIGSTASLNSSGIQFTGLASGVDTDRLIQGLTALGQSQVRRLENQQNQIAQRRNAFKEIETRLFDLQNQSFRLGRTFNSSFDGKKVTISHQDLVAATASASAAPGVYAFKINAVAKAHQIASQAFTDKSATITQGNLQIKVGEGATTTITIDSTNNTLQGLANAINAAAGDVSATIVNDGSATPYKLLLTSKKTGQVNDIEITNNLADSAGDAIKPTLTTTVQAAADASITVGSGGGAMTIASATNTMDGVFNGVTLNLLTADPTKDITVTVANDTDTAKKAVQDFTKAFNDLVDFIDAQSTFDTKTNRGGLLLGNSSAMNIRDEVTRALGQVVPRVNSKANGLTTVGISFDDKGRLEVDDSKLTQALNGQIAGVTANDVRRLFALDGVSSHANVQFVTATYKTKVTGSSLEVDITQAARQASLSSTNALVGPNIVIDGTNKSFSLNVDGTASTTFSLAEKTYTFQELAQELQGKINTDSQLNGKQVSVSVDNNRLKITSLAYGTLSKVTILGGTAVTSGILGFVGTETDTGVNVAGSYKVNGVTEAATGTGQFLAGNATNANTADLQLKVTMTANQVVGGAEGTVTVTRGLASELGNVLQKFLDPVNGRLKSLDKGFQDNIDGLQKSIDRQTARIQAQQENLVKQFAAMEGIVSKLKNMGNYLTGQLAGLSSLK